MKTETLSAHRQPVSSENYMMFSQKLPTFLVSPLLSTMLLSTVRSERNPLPFSAKG